LRIDISSVGNLQLCVRELQLLAHFPTFFKPRRRRLRSALWSSAHPACATCNTTIYSHKSRRFWSFDILHSLSHFVADCTSFSASGKTLKRIVFNLYCRATARNDV